MRCITRRACRHRPHPRRARAVVDGGTAGTQRLGAGRGRGQRVVPAATGGTRSIAGTYCAASRRILAPLRADAAMVSPAPPPVDTAAIPVLRMMLALTTAATPVKGEH